MGKPVKDAKLKAQQVWPGATVHSRGKGFIKHQHPTNLNRFMLDTQVGGVGWHFGDGPFTEAHEVDTAWVDADPILDAPWQKKMVLADYNAYAFREPTLRFNQGQLIEYAHPASGEAVNFQPTQLQWTNDLDQISPIEDPQAVVATIDDDKLTWADAYGTGIDFQWETQTARLMKYVNINSLAELGAPPQFIIDGGNPVLRVELLFQKSANTEIWVDGVLWDEKSNNPQVTSNNVEFRLASTGEPVWWFKAPAAWGSGEENNNIFPTMRLRESANNLFVEILTPWSWLETAVYPVVVDATVDYQVVASADDAWQDTAGVNITLAVSNSDNNDEYTAMRFTGVTIPAGATINADTYIDFTLGTATSLDEPYMTFWAEDGATPAQFTAAAGTGISGRTPTTATITYSDGSGLNISAVGDWYSAYLKCGVQTIVAELEVSYDYSSGLAMVFIGVCVTDNGQDDFAIQHYDGSTSLCPKLHIDYTEVGGVTRQGTATLAGAGTVAANGDTVAAADATLAGTGAVAAAGGNTRFATSTLSGVGSLTAAGSNARLATSALSGTGSLTAAGSNARLGTATLSGVGSATAAGSRIGAGGVTLPGVGSLAAAGTIYGEFFGTATLSGVGTLAAVGTVVPGGVVQEGAATLSGVGSLAAIGTLITTYYGTVTLSCIGTLQAIGTRLPVAPEKVGGDDEKEKPKQYEYQKDMLDMEPIVRPLDPAFAMRQEQKSMMKANAVAEALVRQNEQAAADRVNAMLAREKVDKDKADRRRASSLHNLAKAQIAKEAKAERQAEINKGRKKSLRKARAAKKRKAKKK